MDNDQLFDEWMRRNYALSAYNTTRKDAFLAACALKDADIDLLKKHLAAISVEQKPVAWIYAEDSGKGHRNISDRPPSSQDPQGMADAEVFVTPLYLNPWPIPDGWRLVPVDPTDKMFEAGEDSGFQAYTGTFTVDVGTCYTAMLAAAPTYKPEKS